MNILLTLTLHTANLLGSFGDPFEFAGDYGPEMNPTRETVFELVCGREEPNLRPASRFIKRIQDKYAALGQPLPLSILGSTKPLCGKSGVEMERILLAELLEEAPLDEDLLCYWRYEGRILRLIADKPGLVDEVNKVKALFAQTLGNQKMRAKFFREKLDQANSQLLFTQECDAHMIEALTCDGRFFGVEGQNREDGTVVFLGSDAWEPSYLVVLSDARMNLVIATLKESGERYLLASIHGSSSRPEDGRQKLREIHCHYQKFCQEFPSLQLLIGIDANTKSKQDVADLYALLEELDWVSTKVGPTTVKQRKVTIQKAKEGRLCIDREDFLITTKSGRPFTQVTLGFKHDSVDPTRMLPDLANPSDHYPVGATLVVESH